MAYNNQMTLSGGFVMGQVDNGNANRARYVLPCYAFGPFLPDTNSC